MPSRTTFITARWINMTGKHSRYKSEVICVFFIPFYFYYLIRWRMAMTKTMATAHDGMPLRTQFNQIQTMHEWANKKWWDGKKIVSAPSFVQCFKVFCFWKKKEIWRCCYIACIGESKAMEAKIKQQQQKIFRWNSSSSSNRPINQVNVISQKSVPLGPMRCLLTAQNEMEKKVTKGLGWLITLMTCVRQLLLCFVYESIGSSTSVIVPHSA